MPCNDFKSEYIVYASTDIKRQYVYSRRVSYVCLKRLYEVPTQVKLETLQQPYTHVTSY